jgi:hypothetical protein
MATGRSIWGHPSRRVLRTLLRMRSGGGTPRQRVPDGSIFRRSDLRSRNQSPIGSSVIDQRIELPDAAAYRSRRRHRNQKFAEVVRPSCGRRARSFDPTGRVLHAAWAERRRQDDDAAHGGRPVAARCRIDRDPRHRRARPPRRGEAGHGLDFRRADDLRQAHAVRIPRVRRRAVGASIPPDRKCGRAS